MMTRRGQKLSEGLHAEISLIVFDLPALQSTGSLCFVGYGILCDSNREIGFSKFFGEFFLNVVDLIEIYSEWFGFCFFGMVLLPLGNHQGFLLIWTKTGF